MLIAGSPEHSGPHPIQQQIRPGLTPAGFVAGSLPRKPIVHQINGAGYMADVGDFATIRKAIIEEGQDQARQVKNSIKKASFSSGGLIELLK